MYLMVDKIKIRDFRTEDISSILEIHSQHLDSFEGIEITEDFLLHISQRDDFRFFIVELDSKVVGFVGVLFYDNVGRAEIGPIGVRGEYHGFGIGTALVEYVMEFLKERNMHRVIVRVKAKNKEGLDFFSFMEFRQEAYLKKYNKDGEDVIQLVRFL